MKTGSKCVCNGDVRSRKLVESALLLRKSVCPAVHKLHAFIVLAVLDSLVQSTDIFKHQSRQLARLTSYLIACIAAAASRPI